MEIHKYNNIVNVNEIYADLHVHTTASDGIYTPSEILKLAKDVGLKVVAITDHDTIDGIDDSLFELAKQLGICFIPGIELSCGWDETDTSVHVLGLFIDHKSEELRNLLNKQKQMRYFRALKILDLLESLSIDVSELRKEFLNSTDKVLGRPHIARYLHKIGIVSEFQEAFDKYLARGKPAYVPKEHLLPSMAVDVIHKAGGLAIIAHPGLTLKWNEVWSKIQNLNWDGIEVYYSDHTPDQVNYFTKLALSKGYLLTGGSDYHGEYGKHIQRFGKFGLSKENFEVILSFLKTSKKEYCIEILR